MEGLALTIYYAATCQKCGATILVNDHGAHGDRTETLRVFDNEHVCCDETYTMWGYHGEYGDMIVEIEDDCRKCNGTGEVLRVCGGGKIVCPDCGGAGMDFAIEPPRKNRFDTILEDL